MTILIPEASKKLEEKIQVVRTNLLLESGKGEGQSEFKLHQSNRLMEELMAGGGLLR